MGTPAPNRRQDRYSEYVRIRIDLSYDGTDFSGWAIQPGRRTVQGELEAACDRILRLPEPARLTVAGRTDAGVHARAQVAHIDIPGEAWRALPGRSDLPPERALARRLNAVVPHDLAIRSTAAAPPGFDARFSALWRRYSYRVIHVRDPLQRRYTLFREEVDGDLLNEAARAMLGERDFTAFCKARPGATAIRTLQRFFWEPWQDSTGAHGVVAHVQADAFCHNMVRSLVGACLAVGAGRRDVDWLREVAESNERSSQVQVAPAHPLVLEEVGYPQASELAQRAVQTRAVRAAPEEEE